MTEISLDFNWVKARAECSVAKIFSTLHRGAEEDVREANQIKMTRFPGYPSATFAVASNSRGNHFVVHEEGNTETAVKFFLASDHIEINSAKRRYMLTPTLDDEGKCKLRIDGGDEVFDQWHIRKRILEDLFFGNGLLMPSTPQTSEGQ